MDELNWMKTIVEQNDKEKNQVYQDDQLKLLFIQQWKKLDISIEIWALISIF